MTLRLTDWTQAEIETLFKFEGPEYDPDADVLYAGDLIDVEHGMNDVSLRRDVKPKAPSKPPMSLSDMMSTAYSIAGNLFEIKPKD